MSTQNTETPWAFIRAVEGKVVNSLLCSSCKKIKPIAMFHKNTTRHSGYQADCIECQRIRMKKYHKTKEGKLSQRAAVKKHRKTDAGRMIHQQCNKRYYLTIRGKNQKYRSQKKLYKKYPAARKAHALLNRAVDLGYIKRGLCVICGTGQNIEGHHDNYKKPYLVTWYCQKHHRDHHLSSNKNYYTESGSL